MRMDIQSLYMIFFKSIQIERFLRWKSWYFILGLFNFSTGNMLLNLYYWLPGFHHVKCNTVKELNNKGLYSIPNKFHKYISISHT